LGIAAKAATPPSISTRDRIEESRDGEDDIEETSATSGEMDSSEIIATPPTKIWRKKGDRIENTREHSVGKTSTIKSKQAKVSPAEVPKEEVRPLGPADINGKLYGLNPQVRPYQIEKSSPPTTPKLDQRTVRLLYSNEFVEMIRMNSMEHIEKFLDGSKAEKLYEESGISFAVLKRPMLNAENEGGEFDVIGTPSAHPNAVVLYEATMMPDRRTRDLKAHLFRFDGVFSSSEEYYIRMGQNAVFSALNGGHGTFVLIGSPSSGKSFNITDIQERAALDIFGDASYDIPLVSVKCLELYGSQCIDLLGPVGSYVGIVEANGSFEVKGVVVEKVSTAQEFLTALTNAKRRFATQTIVRGKSEPCSYQLSMITIENRDNVGSLILLECPSSDQGEYAERDIDPKEATPLIQLMDNLRAKVSQKPLHSTCNLTKILHSALRNIRSHTCVLGAISPVSSDTEATLSTLLSLKKMMNGFPTERADFGTDERCDSPAENDVELPRQWSREKLLKWMVKKKLLTATKAGDIVTANGDLSGRTVMRMTRTQLKDVFYFQDEDGDEKAKKLFVQLRVENDVRARHKVKRLLALEKDRLARERERSGC
jgi:hypothetical protein